MRGAKSRRTGLKSAKQKKLKELQQQETNRIAVLVETGANIEADDEVHRLRMEIEDLKQRIKSIPFLDPVDLRYNNWDKVQLPSVQAVMFCVMDVSGSMDERKKELAKTFFILLYLFLQRNYDKIAIEFVRYHSTAALVDEEEFYYGRDSGGTVTSTGLQLVYDTIVTKYPTDMWNIYVAHGSDGDNFTSDNDELIDVLTNKLLPLVQYYAYVQISDQSYGYTLNFGPTLKDTFAPIAASSNRLEVAEVATEADVYPVFVKLFERKVA